MLEISLLNAGYNGKQVLFDLSIEVREGEIAALIGPNGAGKSTVLKAVYGLIPAWSGQVRFRDARIDGSAPAQNLARGIVYVPQGNRVFPDLSVVDNLAIGGLSIRGRELKGRIDRALELFPMLREHTHKVAGRLSGGEQQLVALARALVPSPRLLMLDEPSLGLAPNLASKTLVQIAEVSRKAGLTVLIVEQKVQEVLGISDRVYSLKQGAVAFAGIPEELRKDAARLRHLFL